MNDESKPRRHSNAETNRRRSPKRPFIVHRSSLTIDKFSGDFVDRVTPVPIPNTVVKPVGADDTAAFSCGKVGSRRINIEKARSEMDGLFCVYTLLLLRV